MILEFPQDLMTRSNGFLMFHSNNENEQGDTTPISLPLPPSLVYADGMSYENFDRNALAGAITDKNNDVEDIVKMLGATFENLTAGGASDVASTMLAKMGNKTSQLRNRKAPNPNTAALFKSPNLRVFQFSFELVATDRADALLIQEIIQVFRGNMYPYDDSPENTLKLTYKMPNTFTIHPFLLDPKGIPHYLFNGKFGRFKKCYLTAMQTSFSGNAILAEAGTNPMFAKTDLSLSFMEEETLLSKDMADGY
jgi:hypothetical protein